MEKRNLKKERGITLIALVVTIVVLLILAGISIAALVNDNGVLSRARDSKTQTEIGEEKDLVSIAYGGAKLEKLGALIVADDINKQFTLNGTKATATQTEGSNIITINFIETQRAYEIQENGTVKGPITIVYVDCDKCAGSGEREMYVCQEEGCNELSESCDNARLLLVL